MNVDQNRWRIVDIMMETRETITPTTNQQNRNVALLGLNRTQLGQLADELGEPSFRADQLYEWIYEKRAADFGVMSSLPEGLRNRLSSDYCLRGLHLLDEQASSDGTVKYLFRTHDELNVESVLIPSEARDDQNEPRRRTLCVSSQVGCPLDCKFCATASMKLKRNLTVGEIVEQFIAVQERSADEITNVVFMGMGEPMLNYDNVFQAIDLLSDPANRMVPASRITVSTAGVIPGIERMTEEGRTVKLAVSLHMTTENSRKRLMPIGRKYSLSDLLKAVEEYYRTTRIPVTYEYILFDGLNDEAVDARRLARISRRVPSKVNVIPFHPIDFTDPTGVSATLKPSTPSGFNAFVRHLREHDVQVMVRSSSGIDIAAACGQLAIEHDAVSLN